MAEVTKYDDFKELGSEPAVKVVVLSCFVYRSYSKLMYADNGQTEWQDLEQTDKLNDINIKRYVLRS